MQWTILLLSLLTAGSLLLNGCSLPSITFHGRVMDQFNQPVQHAQLRQFGDSTVLTSGSGRGHAETDEQGNFKIHANGIRLVIGRITRKGYEFSHQPDGGMAREMIQSRLLHSKFFIGDKDPRGIYSNYKDYTREHPYVIHAWRQQLSALSQLLLRIENSGRHGYSG